MEGESRCIEMSFSSLFLFSWWQSLLNFPYITLLHTFLVAATHYFCFVKVALRSQKVGNLTWWLSYLNGHYTVFFFFFYFKLFVNPMHVLFQVNPSSTILAILNGYFVTIWCLFDVITEHALHGQEDSVFALCYQRVDLDLELSY